MSANPNILSPLAQQAIQDGELVAFRFKDQDKMITLNYRDSFSLILDIAKQLQQQGLKSGDRLACIGHNCIELALLYWACIETNILFCPISPRLAFQQHQQLIHDYNIKAFWSPEPLILAHCTPLNLDLKLNLFDNSVNSSFLATQARAIIPSDPVNLVLTSGSSGTPKAAIHSLANHIASAQGSMSQTPLHTDDNWLLSLPLFHIGGLAILNRCALAGASVIFSNDKLPIAEQIVSAHITHLSLVEAQLIKLLEIPNSLNSLKYLLLGGGAIAPKYLQALQGYPLTALTSYGMTEMSSQISTGSALQQGSGAVLANREVAIREGVIHVKGATLFLGYLQPGDSHELQLKLSLTADGWFNTNDIGNWTEAGQLQITGRTDNMFICGGENIQPEEIERALKSHPDIENVIVFGQADSNFHLLPAAIIQMANESQPLNQDKLERFLTDKIARFKRPRHYYQWPKDIKTEGLKINRKQLIRKLKLT